MRAASTAALLALAAGCSLPDRDNPIDPLHRPVAKLSFFDASPGCDAATVGTNLPSILVLARGRCLGLSARESSDPDDGVPAGGFRFELVAPTPMTLTSSFVTSSVLVLDADEVRDLPADVELRFRLTVRDARGTEVSAEESVQVSNSAPVLPHVSSMTIPLGGYPWAPTTFDVHFEVGEAIDPNGDDIDNYCWQFVTGEVCSPDRFAPGFTQPLAVDDPLPYRVPFRAEDDGGAASLESMVKVRRRVPNIWTTTNYSVPRLDALRRQLRLVNQTGAFNATYYAVPGADPVIVAAVDRAADRGVTLLQWPSLVEGNVVSIPSGSGLPILPPQGDQVAIVEISGTTATIRRFAVTGGTLGAPVTTTATVPSESGSVSAQWAAGAIWASKARQNLLAFDPADGTLLNTFTHPTLDVGGAFLPPPRPVRDELWIARSVDALGVGDPASVEIYDSPTAPPTVIPTGEAEMRHISWIDENQFWAIHDEFVALVDAAALDAGASYQDAILLRVPITYGAVYSVVDPSSDGDLIVTSLTSPARRVRRDGTYDDILNEVSPVVLFVDHQGGLYVPGNDFVRAGDDFDGLLSPSEPIVNFAGGGPDGQGALWLTEGTFVDSFSTRLIKVAEDGTIARSHSTFVVGGVERPVPQMGFFRTVPGKNAAWGFAAIPLTDPLGLYRIDFATDPPTGTLVLTSAQLANFDGEAILEASTPAAASEFVWMMQSDTVVRVGVDGTITPSDAPIFEFPRGLKAARSLRSNGLCLGTVEDNSGAGTDFLRGRWFDASTTTAFLSAAFSVPNSTQMGPVAVSPGPLGTGDYCWYTYQEPGAGTCSFGATRVAVYQAGTMIQEYTYTPSLPGNIVGIKPLDLNRFWLAIERCNATGVRSTELEFVSRPGIGAPFSTSFNKSGTDVAGFLDWETNAPDDILPP